MSGKCGAAASAARAAAIPFRPRSRVWLFSFRLPEVDPRVIGSSMSRSCRVMD